MSIKQSTGLVNFLAGEGSYRKAFEDCVYRIWDGTPPITADAAMAGNNLLCEITISSGSVVSGLTDRSTPRVYKITEPNDTTIGHTCIVNVTVDGVGPTAYTYTIVSADTTDIKVAIKIARMLNDIAQLSAIADQDATNPAVLWVQGRIDGLDLTLANGGGTTTLTVTAKQTAVRVNTLMFDPPTLGVFPKPTGSTWSGLNLLTGVASFGRFCLPSDTNALSTVFPRLQLSIATSGADMNLTNTTLTQGATTTITSGNFTEPLSE